MSSDLDLLRDFIEEIGARKLALKGDPKEKRSMDLLYSDELEDFLVRPEPDTYNIEAHDRYHLKLYSIYKKIFFANFNQKLELITFKLKSLRTKINFNNTIIPEFKKLKELEIGDKNQISMIRRDFFYNLKNLERLEIYHNDIDELSLDLSKNLKLSNLCFSKFKIKQLTIKFPENHTLSFFAIPDIGNDVFYNSTKNLVEIKTLYHLGNKLRLNKEFFDYLIDKHVSKFTSKKDPAEDIMFLDKLSMFNFRSRRFGGKWEFFNDAESPFQ